MNSIWPIWMISLFSQKIATYIRNTSDLSLNGSKEPSYFANQASAHSIETKSTFLDISSLALELLWIRLVFGQYKNGLSPKPFEIFKSSLDFAISTRDLFTISLGLPIH